MSTSTPLAPAPILAAFPLSPPTRRLLDLLADGVSAPRIGHVYGIRPARRRDLLQEAAHALGCTTARPGEILFRATVLQILPPPPGGYLRLSDDALVLTADLALGKSVHTIAHERRITEGDLDAHGKRVLAELPAFTYSQAVYLATPTLLAVPAHRITAARSRLAKRTGQTLPAPVTPSTGTRERPELAAPPSGAGR